MSVAEKLTAIADRIRSYTANTDKLTLDGMASGVQEVYGVGIAHGQDSGYENGYMDGYNEGEEDGWSDGYGEGLDHGVVQGIEEGIEQGKRDAYDEFWDNFQQNGTRTNYNACFGAGWTVELFKPKYQIKASHANFTFFDNYGDFLIYDDFVEFCNNLAAEQGKTAEKNPELFDENGNYQLLDYHDAQQAQYGLSRLHSPHFGVIDLSNATNTYGLFYSHGLGVKSCVKKIDKLISTENTVFNNTFDQAIYLTNITMSGVVAKSINFGTCPLNEASVRSVVSVLSPTVTGQTVTFKASSKALFSDSEWAELIAPISNWTVAIK